MCMGTIPGLKPLEETLSVQSVSLNKILMLQGSVWIMKMAGEMLILQLVDQVSNDLITSKIIMTITVLHVVLLFEIKKKHWFILVTTSLSLDVVHKLPSPYSIFIRFSANFSSIASSGTTSSVLDNIRITVRLHVFFEYIIINSFKQEAFLLCFDDVCAIM